MRIVSGRLPRSRYLERGAAELSREAQKRLQWFDHYRTRGRNAALTCRYFGISRETFYRWKQRYDPQALTTLEDRSHRPHRRRRPSWTAEQAERVRRLREQYPRWGKLNGQVERANRTHTEEFYEVTPCSLPIADLNRELQAWERIYNTVRPHQALGYLTPQEFLAQSSSPRREFECH